MTGIARYKGVYKIEVWFSITWNLALLQERKENKIDSSGNVQIGLNPQIFYTTPCLVWLKTPEAALKNLVCGNCGDFLWPI